ncbi:MAG: RHS repeat protein, partial [Gammaproteobacteria bacterium]|nr:RHS repeat protein [Gammaproteobacteria bacterium]
MPDYEPPLDIEYYTEEENDVYFGILFDWYQHPVKIKVTGSDAVSETARGDPWYYPAYYQHFVLEENSTIHDDLFNKYFNKYYFSLPIPKGLKNWPGTWKYEVFIAPLAEEYSSSPDKVLFFDMKDDTLPIINIEQIPAGWTPIDSSSYTTRDANSWMKFTELNGTAEDNGGYKYPVVDAGVTSMELEMSDETKPVSFHRVWSPDAAIDGGGHVMRWNFTCDGCNTRKPADLHWLPGEHSVNIKAKDAAGNESENGNLTVTFINDPPEITDITAHDVIIEGIPYFAIIKAKDINHNLKEIKIDWGEIKVPMGVKQVGTPAQASEFTASFVHLYLFGNISPLDRPSGLTLSTTAHDEADIAGPAELWTVPVLSAAAQDNRCPKFVVFKGGRLIADPVDTATGAQLLEHDLLEVQGLLPLSFTLRYNSLLLNREGVTGRGWEDSLYNARLEKLPQGHVLARWSVNRVNLFEKDPDGGYLASHSACRFDTLEEQADGSFTLTRDNTSVYRFSPEGRLTALGDRRGRFVHITHDAEGRTAKVTEPVSGVYLEYVYNAAGRLESVRDGSGRTARLQYDGEGRLAAITDAAGQTTAYAYNQHGQILAGTDHEGRLLFSNAYDDKYRILEQDDANPGNLPVRLSYDDDSRPGYRVATVTDREGHAKVYTTRRDDLQLVSIHKGSGELIIQYDYNADGRRIAAVDANNHRVTYVYDVDDDPATLDT